ncbi:MAG: 3-oxoacyl-ACP reductase [Streptococcus sp.]|nr:3-oxoacyl-ACP reductase [Streptococcus sp.]
MTKIALVTGVSSGIGLAQAQLLLKNNWSVYGVDKANGPELSGNFHFLQLDLTNDLQILFDWLPKVDLLCNTAGILDDYLPLDKVTDKAWTELFEINLVVPMKLTQFYLKKMLKENSGIIINMCSIASFLAGGGGAAYTASKHALAGLTKQTALDYAKSGVQVFGLAPGAVKTKMTASDFEPGGLSQWVADETPIKRWIEPQEVAELTLFLASGQAQAMQGEIIKLDGGWSLK